MRFTDNMSIATATMDESDIMAGTDVSSGIDKKFTLGNLADYFLETHELSLNGTNQTVKHAIDDIGDVGEIREAVEEEAEAREAADTTLNEIKADKTQVDALAEAKADQADVDELEGRVDTLAAMFAGTSVETVLFEGSAIGAGTIINLSDSITSYDFLDIYAYKHGTTDIRTIPATTSAEYYLRFTNISNNPTNDKGVQINEMLLQTTSATTVTIANEVTWEWSGVSTANARASVVTPSDAGTELARILKIVGRKLVGNTELADLRIGYDGTTYASAGAAVRGQVGELHTEIGDLSDLETEDQTNLVAAINEAASSGGSGMTEAVKAALLQIAQKVAYIDQNGQTYYNALYNALYPPAELVSIAAVYTQSGTVYTTDTLDSLKNDLVVTATFTDLSTRTVLASDYTLSGTLAVGTSTITVSYGGKTTTFSVTVSEYSTAPVIMTEGVCWSKTAPNTVNKAGFGITQWYEYEFTQEALEACQYWDAANGYMTTTGWAGINVYTPDANTYNAGYSWPASANYKHVAGKDHVYTNMFSITRNAVNSMKFHGQNAGSILNNGVSFSIPLLDKDDCYAYWYKPAAGSILPTGVAEGDIIFAGANTPYYGLHNISEAET